ncbi:DUF6261 family protein [Streptococcus sp. sy018]|uniref:DUF6261 family protein n=1 Tax=Streptococcus sp. sy018 TaxID=2600147 RepID=UPI0011B5977E|nr:DUF6261 family protein [Streptococcus sp. sy018]TWS95403.1 hypothetical protein FRX52_00965 [Streptococcus sp. sy018]
MKRMYKITTLSTKLLDNSEFFQLLTESKDYLMTFSQKEQTEPVYLERLDKLEELLVTFRQGLHKTKSSQFTQLLEEADRNRNDALVTLTNFIKAFARIKDTEITQAYQNLSSLLKGYVRLTTQSYEKETEGINHLLHQLASPSYQKAVEKLALTSYVTQLKNKQEQFEQLYKERLTEQSVQKPSQIRQLRLQLQETYDFLVDFTALIAYAYPERQAFVELRNQLNSVRERYRKQHSHKSIKKEKVEKQPPIQNQSESSVVLV